MKELNELVELANHLDGESWEYSRTTPYSRGYITGRNGRTIVQTSDGEVPASACRFIEMADPAAILAIAEAFRALEQRAEAAEAKLSELEKQQAVGVARMEMAIGKEGLRYYQCFVDMRPDLVVAELNTGMELFTRPAPAVSLAEVVPDDDACPKSGSHEWVHHIPCHKPEYEECNNCGQRRNIEDAK